MRLNQSIIILGCLFWALLFISADVHAQFEAYHPDTSNLDHFPMRYVRINVHIVRNSDGSGNFEESEGRAYVRHLVAIANIHLADNKKMNLPVDNHTPVLPTRYRYVLTGLPEDPEDEGIYFIDDTELNDFNSLDHRNMADSRLFVKYGKQKARVLNIFLMENNDTSDYTTRGIGMSHWAKVGSCYASFKKRNRGTWALRGLFSHEIGHCLGLAHTWSGWDACDDTPTHPNCWNNAESGRCKVGSNNMMDYNAHQMALTPCQIGKIHSGFASDGYTSRGFLIENWCTYKADSSTVVRAGDSIVWLGSKDLEGDIVLKKKSTLIIHGRVSLPKGARVLLGRKSKLIIAPGGEITNLCNEDWNGFKLTGWTFNKSRRFKRAIKLQSGSLNRVTVEEYQMKAIKEILEDETQS